MAAGMLLWGWGPAVIRTLFQGQEIPTSHLFQLFPDTAIEVEGFINDSGKNGPVLVVVAGIHGNEPAGVHAAESLREWIPTYGTLVVIPRANGPAVEAGMRHTPDMQDLNRAFPGKDPGTRTQKLAGKIIQTVLELEPALVLDLHESFGRYGTAPLALGQSLIANMPDQQAGFLLELTEAVNRTTALEHPFTWTGPPLSGTLAQALEKEGIPAVTVETDMELPRDLRVEMHREVVLESMALLEMTCLETPCELSLTERRE